MEVEIQQTNEHKVVSAANGEWKSTSQVADFPCFWVSILTFRCPEMMRSFVRIYEHKKNMYILYIWFTIWYVCICMYDKYMVSESRMTPCLKRSVKKVVKFSVLGGQYDSHSLTCSSDRLLRQKPRCPLSITLRAFQPNCTITRIIWKNTLLYIYMYIFFKVHFTFLWYQQSIVIWYIIPAQMRCFSTTGLANRSQTSPVWPGNMTSTREGRGPTVYTLAPKGGQVDPESVFNLQTSSTGRKMKKEETKMENRWKPYISTQVKQIFVQPVA